MTKQNMPRLTESQLFTIEALNKIQGFVWPDGATSAAMDNASVLIHFYAMEPVAGRFSFSGVCVYAPDAISDSDHPDWRNSLITKEQFDRVDGWVKNDGSHHRQPSNVSSVIDVMINRGTGFTAVAASEFLWNAAERSDCVFYWRYHKPSNAEINEAVAIKDPAPCFARRSFPWVDCENGFIIPDRIKEVELAISGGPIIEVLAELDTDLQKQGWPKFQSAHIDLKRVICNNTNQNITAHVIRYLPIDAREFTHE